MSRWAWKAVSEAVQSAVGRKTATLGTALAGDLPSGTQPCPGGSIFLAPVIVTTRETDTATSQAMVINIAVEGNLGISPMAL